VKYIFTIVIFFLRLCIINLDAQTDSLNFDVFGNLILYHPSESPTGVALFVSGDGGWTLGVIDMARALAKEGALVAGIDIRHYLNSLNKLQIPCYYPAADFERLSLFLQKKFKFPQYFKPVLCGYSSGATLVYGVLKQAPANTFKGAISLGFCPDIEIKKSLCKGNGLITHVLKPGISYYLEPDGSLSAPFFVLQGMIDKVCSYKDAEKYLNGMNNAVLISLPKVGHGFAVEANWLPQLKDAYYKIKTAPSYAEEQNRQNKLLQEQNLQSYPGDLPLTLVPSALKDTMPIACLISGDGGWTNFDHTLAVSLAEKGISVIGLDAQKYFWDEKTKEETAAEISKVLNHYLIQWKRKSFILIGYSFGANVVPFIANRLPLVLRGKLRGVYMLSPDLTADFEIHVADMLNISTRQEKYQVIPEAKRIVNPAPVCVFGEEEDVEERESYLKQKIKVIVLPGSHHFNDDFLKLSDVIVNSL
jgi:type IV secretory pathway VirJ component